MIESYISDKERDVIEFLIQGKTITETAKELHISKASASERLRNLRERYRRAKEFVLAYEKFRSQIPTRYL